MEHQLPLSIVDLKAGDTSMIFVCEPPELVEQIVNEADTRLITLTRWSSSGTSEFRTRPDNVLNVRENK